MDVPTLITKLEDIVGHDLKPFQDYILNKFCLSKIFFLKINRTDQIRNLNRGFKPSFSPSNRIYEVFA